MRRSCSHKVLFTDTTHKRVTISLRTDDVVALAWFRDRELLCTGTLDIAYDVM